MRTKYYRFNGEVICTGRQDLIEVLDVIAYPTNNTPGAKRVSSFDDLYLIPIGKVEGVTYILDPPFVIYAIKDRRKTVFTNGTLR